MQYGDLLAKLASGKQLSVGEIDQLRLQSNRIENAAFRGETIMSQQGGFSPEVFQNSGEFSMGPLPGIKLRRTAVQELAHGAQEALEFGEKQHDSTARLSWASGDPTKLVSTSGRGTMILLCGMIIYTSNATGYRSAVLGEYTPTGALVSGNTMAQIAAASGAQTSVPFAMIRQVHVTSGYYTLSGLQTSGGNLDVEWVDMSAFILR